MNKLVRISLIVVLLGFIGAYLASPYYTLYQLKNAVEKHDTATLVDAVDFVSVKASIKDQLKTKLATELPDTNDEFALLGAAFATVMIDGLIDAVVSPKSMELLIQGKDITQDLSLAKLQDSMTNQATNTQTPAKTDQATTTASSSITDELEYHPSYQTLNTFSIDIKKPSANQPLTVIMQRYGLFTWKIVDVRLPLE
ncbi:DUF2939 domain-containing protein [Moraxella pluranimalium]|uniref:DUF2939 domain-containing protein n=1 Tax=Moraxella pluranimalium TaxID=470453 RepID=A0A1T0CTN1_9GAMM|nr:DUF2939 domain-containing protein [Moraxella pluranimalium]OOS25718.1 hypothetical protein B0680_02570 [Moraxella pluranimalium]